MAFIDAYSLNSLHQVLGKTQKYNHWSENVCSELLKKLVLI